MRTDGRGYAWADIAQAMYLTLMRMPYDGNVRDLFNVLRDGMKEHRDALLRSAPVLQSVSTTVAVIDSVTRNTVGSVIAGWGCGTSMSLARWNDGLTTDVRSRRQSSRSLTR